MRLEERAAGLLFLLDERIRREPRNAKLRFDKGQLLRAGGRWREALGEFQEALSIDPEWGWRLDLLTWVPRRTGEDSMAREARVLEDIVSASEDCALAHQLLGLAWARLSLFDQAVASFTRALELEPGAHWVYALRSLALDGGGDVRAALDDMARAIELHPADARALGHKGVLHLRAGEASRALESLDGAVRVRPEGWTYAWRGEVALAVGRYEQALADLDHALRLFPPWYRRMPLAWAWAWRGGALVRLGRPEQALPCFAEALAVDPTDDEAWVWKAEALIGLGDPNGAREAAQASIGMSKRLSAFLLEGLAAAQLGDRAACRAAFKEASERGPLLMRAVGGRSLPFAASACADLFRRALELCRGSRSRRPIFFDPSGGLPGACG